jgi:hypothetical protein
MTHVFISYSRQNNDYAECLCDELVKKGFNVWRDNENITTGEEWYPSIEKAIETCAVFLVIMTPASAKSKWVHREILQAEKHNKIIFPLLLDGEIFSILAHIQCVDVTRNHNKLPKPAFYRDLAQFAPRKPVLTHEQKQKISTHRRENMIRLSPDKGEVLPTVRKITGRGSEGKTMRRKPLTGSVNKTEDPFNIARWIEFARQGNNNFYGMVRLSIALEAHEEHKKAVFYLRKAQKLEPRISDRVWH